MAKGPTKWVREEDLMHLDDLGFPNSFFRHIALASRARVLLQEKWGHVNPENIVQKTRDAYQGSTIETWTARDDGWQHFANNSYAQHILDSKTELNLMGST